ncbi:MAG: hypothetical protein ACT4QG_11240 [Sporichthyaceae bacterium]
MPGKPFDNVSRKLRGHEAKEQAARAAQDAAADAFYRMDRASRDLALQVESFVASGEDAGVARRLSAEYEPIRAEAEFRSERYLATLDAHPVLDTTPLDKLYTATNAYRQATGDLLEWAAKLEAFLDANISTFARTTAALDRLGTHRQRANARLEEARATVAALAEAGAPVGEAGAALDRAEAAAAELAAAVGKKSVPELIALADGAAVAAEAVRSAVARAEAAARDAQARREREAREAAERAEAKAREEQAFAEAAARDAQARRDREAREARERAEAEAREAAARAKDEARKAAELAALAEAAPRRMASLRTRRDAIAFRAEKIEETLRGLRRDWSEGNWADLADVGARVGEHLVIVESDLAAAASAGGAGDWRRADATLRDAADRLTAAATLLDILTARQELLVAARDASADLVGQVRFRLRDAQRLVMAGRAEPPQPWAGELDALVARLDAAGGALEGVHPDYWAYRAELASITDAVADLVRRFNAAG